MYQSIGYDGVVGCSYYVTASSSTTRTDVAAATLNVIDSVSDSHRPWKRLHAQAFVYGGQFTGGGKWCADSCGSHYMGLISSRDSSVDTTIDSGSRMLPYFFDKTISGHYFMFVVLTGDVESSFESIFNKFMSGCAHLYIYDSAYHYTTTYMTSTDGFVMFRECSIKDPASQLVESNYEFTGRVILAHWSNRACSINTNVFRSGTGFDVFYLFDGNNSYERAISNLSSPGPACDFSIWVE